MDTETRKHGEIRLECNIWCYVFVYLLLLGFCSSVKLHMKASANNVPFGDSFTINCTVNSDNKSEITSKDLQFSLGRQKLNSTIISPTTRRLCVEKPKKGFFNYACTLKISKIPTDGSYRPATTIVRVIDAPSDVTDFECKSNVTTISCTWTRPKGDETQYELTYINGTSIQHVDVTRHGNTFASYINDVYDPVLHFRLNCSNNLFFKTQHFNTDLLAILKPNKPLSLMILSKDSNRVELKWQVYENLVQSIEDHIVYKIYYQIPKFNDVEYECKVNTKDLKIVRYNNTIKDSDVTINYKNVTYNLTGLYANTKYIVKVYVKTTKAESKEFWSESEELEFTTPSVKPRRPPELPVGAFFQSKYQDQRVLYIFWRELKEYEHAGANFKYSFQFNPKNIESHVINPGALMLKIESTDAVEINIWSENEKGMSENKSYLYIPSYRDTELQVHSFTVVAFGNCTYNLLWEAVDDIDSYNIFWCRKETLKICKNIDYNTLAKTATNYEMHFTDNVNYQFAISANRGPRSSGMIWPRCEISDDRKALAEFPIHLYFTKQGPTFVELKWFIDCVHNEKTILAYSIKYCEFDDVNRKCQSKMINNTVNDPRKTSVIISDLLPYTTYKFEISAFNIFGLEMGNDTEYMNTLESTPSRPRIIKISDIKHDSLVISLMPPSHPNGPIKYIKYVIYNFGTAIHSDEVKNNLANITLKELHSFTNYSLTIRACRELTNECSEPTDNIFVRTRIGPSSTLSPIKKNSLVSWLPPEFPGGPASGRYQIKIITNKKTEETINTSKLELRVLTCKNGEYKVGIKVRTISFDNDTHHGALALNESVILPIRDNQDLLEFPSAWSEEIIDYCIKTTNYFFWYIILSVYLIFMVIFVVFNIYKRLRDMMNVPVPKLPPGFYIIHKDEEEDEIDLDKTNIEYETLKQSNNSDDKIKQVDTTLIHVSIGLSNDVNINNVRNEQSKDIEALNHKTPIYETAPLLSNVPELNTNKRGYVQVPTSVVKNTKETVSQPPSDKNSSYVQASVLLKGLVSPPKKSDYVDHRFVIQSLGQNKGNL